MRAPEVTVILQCIAEMPKLIFCHWAKNCYFHSSCQVKMIILSPATVWECGVWADPGQKWGNACNKQPEEVDAAPACGEKSGETFFLLFLSVHWCLFLFQTSSRHCRDCFSFTQSIWSEHSVWLPQRKVLCCQRSLEVMLQWHFERV